MGQEMMPENLGNDVVMFMGLAEIYGGTLNAQVHLFGEQKGYGIMVNFSLIDEKKVDYRREVLAGFSSLPRNVTE